MTAPGIERPEPMSYCLEDAQANLRKLIHRGLEFATAEDEES